MSDNAVLALSDETRVRIRALVEQAEPRWRRHGAGKSNQELMERPLPDAFTAVAHQLRLDAGVDVEAAPHSCTTLIDLVRRLPAHQLLRALAVFSAFLSSPRFKSAQIEGLTQNAFEQQLNAILSRAGPFQLAGAAWSPALPDKAEPVAQAHQTVPGPRGLSQREARPRAIVATALRLEYDAVRAHLSDVEDRVHPRTGAVYEVGKFADPPRSRSVAASGTAPPVARTRTQSTRRPSPVLKLPQRRSRLGLLGPPLPCRRTKAP